VIFNRSHYEDVLVVRVRKLAPKSVWEKRYRHIVEFERMLVDEGTLILKFFLYIDQEEQRERLLARLTEPDKHWKFNPGDLDDRALWPEYIKAYEEMLSRTSTKYAPWWIIPANRKWYRDLVAANILIREAQKLHLEYPEAAEGLDQYIKLLQQVED
jgi:polyphosphate kinase 2 (PPK2 family)